MPSRPNVVLCLCDQLRPFEIGCYGGSVKTPAIDALAARGVRFQVACSNNPVCTPGRSILLTGQYCRTCLGKLGNCAEPVPERNRLRDTTIAEVFRTAGYRTGLIGKWHVEPDPEVVGFESVFYPHHCHRYTGQTYFREGRNESVIAGFCADAEMAELDTWVAERKDEPFFLYYNISQPHMPVWDMPEHYRGLYSPDEVNIRANAYRDGQLPYNENWFKIYLHDYLYYNRHLPYTEQLPEGFDLRRLTALYHGSIAWADAQLAHLMQALERNGLGDDTIVVFTSDHGDLLGSHHAFNKDSLYEEAVRIPMVVRWPSHLEPRVVDTQVASLVDVMPTALSLAGLDTPASVQGTDLSPVVRGEAAGVGGNAAFIETNQTQIGVRTLTHTYGFKTNPERGGDAAVSFFDDTQDPTQMTNLAGHPETAALEGELRVRAEEWNARTPWMLPPDGS